MDLLFEPDQGPALICRMIALKSKKKAKGKKHIFINTSFMKTIQTRILASGILVSVLLALTSCIPPIEEPVKIAVTKLSANYESWLLQSDSTLVITDLYPFGVDSSLALLKDYHGLLITGGEDVFPDWYGMIHDTSRCGGFDRYRDTLEIELIQHAIELGIPILGICRGHQIINITLGGTLIVDIPEDVGTEVIHRCPDKPLDCHHQVFIVEGSQLEEITGVSKGTVNTNHHQALKETGSGLRISALTLEGLPEAIEWKNPEEHSFLLGVQWHPERMFDFPELSTPIAERFVSEAKIRARAIAVKDE